MPQMAHIFGKKKEKGAFAFGGIGRIGLIRPIGHQLVDPLTSPWEGAQKKVGHL